MNSGISEREMSTAALGLTDVLRAEDTQLRQSIPNANLESDAGVGGRPQAGPIGLALSGGGIRSATFSLGVLQALARHKRLASFDYLSTVSGGGYIGSWLSAWIYRAGIDRVQTHLAEQGQQTAASPRSREPPEVTWLRRYSNYLAPRVGLFSLDSLTLIATWLRNVALNLIVLLSALAALFLFPLLLAELLYFTKHFSRAFGFAAAWSGFLFLFAIAYNLWHQGLPISRRRKWLVSTAGVVSTVVIPALVAACTGAIWLFLGRPDGNARKFAIVYVAVLLAALLAVWVIAQTIARKNPVVLLRQAATYALAASGGVAAGVGVLEAMRIAWQRLSGESSTPSEFAALVSFGPPALLFAFGVAGSVYTGLVSRLFFEHSREWWSRLNAWFMAIAGGWLALCLLAFFSLPTLQWISAESLRWITVLGTGWIGSLLAATLVRKPETASKKAQVRVTTLVNIAASIFVIGLLFAISAGMSRALLISAGVDSGRLSEVAEPPRVAFNFTAAGDELDYQLSTKKLPKVSFPAVLQAHLGALACMESKHGIWGASPVQLAIMLMSALLLLFGWRVDVNKFSLHNMYKNRLVRCYLGASNQESRNEQPFTGLDDGDDFPLWKLQTQRPLHLINTSLNMSQGSNLAWQERKAASFVLTPMFCGFSLARTQGDSTSVDIGSDEETLGYRATKEYAAHDREERGFTLGMALATSGAAVSPNMGYATRPAHAFVLTLFNARLGRWSANPARKKWRQPGPYFGLICLLQELFGYSNERRNFVYLSDGGHFENMALYELVRRRCSVIVAVDAGADPHREFEDLGGAIRKCRIDLGVEIVLEHLDLLRGGESMLADQGFIEGTIQYDPSDPAQNGKLILIKPTLCRARAEPVDVLNYAARNKSFPQQSTADQFFDESQFESYRRLGLFIGHRCLAKYVALLPLLAPAAEKKHGQVSREPPTFATTWLDRLFFRRASRGVELPAREGSLVDFFVLFGLASILCLLGGCLLDRTLLSGHSYAQCVSVDSCRDSVESMLRAAAPWTTIWKNRLFWRVQADSLFILVYTATLLMGFVVATKARANHHGGHLRSVLCALVLVAAAVGYIGNFLLLGSLEGSEDVHGAAAQIAPFMTLRFYLVSANLVALLILLGPIVRCVRSRWRKPEVQQS